MSPFRFLALFSTLALATAAQAGRLGDSSALHQYFEHLSEQVEQSASLISFNYALPEATDTLARGCASVSSARVLEFVENLGTAILPSRGCDAVCVEAIAELQSVIDGHAFLECRETETAPYAYIERTRFVSTDRRVAISFELGYSD